MEEIRDWPEEDERLDFIVANEPQSQPHLRPLLGSPFLNEGWKPSSTNIEMIPGPVSFNKMRCELLIAY